MIKAFTQCGSSKKPSDTPATNEIAARLAPNTTGPSSSAKPCMAKRRNSGRLALTRHIWLNAFSMVSICIKAVAPRTTTPSSVTRPAREANWATYFAMMAPAFSGRRLARRNFSSAEPRPIPAGSSEISANAAEIMGTSPIKVAKESAATVCAHCSP
jgi:hypothetical protein